MVYSGINFGSNLGMDTLYSGTVGAAMEGALTGVHSVAVSVDSHEARHFDVACELALDVMSFVRTKTSPATVLNINVPDQPREKIKGIRFTRLGGRYYRDIFVPSEGGGYKMEGAPDAVADDRKLLDVTALAEGYASITPLALYHSPCGGQHPAGHDDASRRGGFRDPAQSRDVFRTDFEKFFGGVSRIRRRIISGAAGQESL